MIVLKVIITYKNIFYTQELSTKSPWSYLYQYSQPLPVCPETPAAARDTATAHPAVSASARPVAGCAHLAAPPAPSGGDRFPPPTPAATPATDAR